MRRRRLRRSLPLVLAVSLAGCSAGVQRPHSSLDAHGTAGPVTGENYTDVLRELDEQEPTPALRPLRDAVARYEAQRGLDRINAGDVEHALAALRIALVHYTPDELGRGGLPAELGPLAHGILDMVSPRGEEAHALAANLVLQSISPPDPGARRGFEEILNWGDSNRREFLAPWTYRAEMADVYKEISRIVPARDVLQRTAEFLIARRRAALEARPPAAGTDNPRMSYEDMAALRPDVQNTPADLAIVYLRIGDIQGAAEHVAQLSEDGENELASALHAIASGDGGAEGIMDLAARLEHVDPAAVAGICRRGRRVYPNDPRFAQCLALAAVHDDDFGLASAHLEAAARLAPNDVAMLRAAIDASGNWLENAIGDDDPAPGRRAYARALALLAQWTRRFPRETPPLATSDLEDLAAQLELGQANLAGAQQHLEQATHAQPPSRDAYVTLAEIAWRHNDGRRAVALLEQGLALPLRPAESDSTFRPLLRLREGLASKAAGDEAGATRYLTEAAGAFDALGRTLEGTALAHAELSHALATDALGQTAAVRHDLDAAVNAAADSREVASQAITFSLARGRWSDAGELDHVARGRLQLDRAWDVYFALWGVVSARMGHLDADGGAADRLEEIAQGATAHSPWTVRLAQRFHGSIDRDALIRYAGNSTGHRAEAMFYEAMLELMAGDTAGAERDLHAVVQSDMLHFLEYEMAWEMLARGVATLRPTPANQSSIPNPAPTTPASGTAAATPHTGHTPRTARP